MLACEEEEEELNLLGLCFGAVSILYHALQRCLCCTIHTLCQSLQHQKHWTWSWKALKQAAGNWPRHAGCAGIIARRAGTTCILHCSKTQQSQFFHQTHCKAQKCFYGRQYIHCSLDQACSSNTRLCNPALTACTSVGVHQATYLKSRRASGLQLPDSVCKDYEGIYAIYGRICVFYIAPFIFRGLFISMPLALHTSKNCQLSRL